MCDGRLTMNKEGKIAVCYYCDTRYTIEFMQHKIQKIKETVNIIGEVDIRHIGSAKYSKKI